jgi:hypothetical protein
VQYGKRGQAVIIAALHEKDEKDTEEEDALIGPGVKRIQRNLRKYSEAMRNLGGSQNVAMAWNSVK